jgi:hypothetical protein
MVKKIRIREDPWVKSGEGYKLSEGLVRDLHNCGIFSLKDVSIGDYDCIGGSIWKSWNS